VIIIRRPLVLLLILSAVAALATWLLLAPRGAAQQAPQRAAPASPVIVAPAVAARDDVNIDVVGSALASSSITVFPAVAGEVARVAFAAGERVRQEQLLVQLVDRSERLAVERADAQTAAAARLLKRYESTREIGAVPASVIDEARLALRSAEIEQAQTREALRDRAVRAPFAGVVGIAQVDPGDRVTPTTALTTLDARSTLSVAFRVPEPFLARLERGQTVELRTIAFPGRSFRGKLSHVDSRVDPVSRTMAVRAAVPNEQDLLRPGMSFSVRLALPGPQVLRVPELAVQWGREGSHLWAVRDGLAHQVPARVVRRLDSAVLVDGAVEAGEPVVVEGFHRLRPQRPVRVVQERPVQEGAQQAAQSPAAASSQPPAQEPQR
jgi:membrane fusion protein (multidrug efflux system)